MRYGQLHQTLITILRPHHLELVLADELSHRELVRIVNRSNISFNGMRTHTIASEELVTALSRDFFRDADTAWPIIKALTKKNLPVIEEVERRTPDDLGMDREQVQEFYEDGQLGPLLWAMAVDRREAVQQIARGVCSLVDELLRSQGLLTETQSETVELAPDAAEQVAAGAALAACTGGGEALAMSPAEPPPGVQAPTADDTATVELTSEGQIVAARRLAEWGDAMESAIADVADEIRELRAQVVQRTSELDRSRADLGSTRRQLAQAEEHVAEVEQALLEQRRLNGVLVDEAGALREQVRQLEAKLSLFQSAPPDSPALEALRRENDQLREQLLQWERRLRYVEDLEAQRRRMATEVDALRHRLLTMIRRTLRGQHELAQHLATARALVEESVLYFQEERSLQIDTWAEERKDAKTRLGVFVDVQNMFYAARSQFHGRLDYETLLRTVVGDRRLAVAVAYTIQTPDVDQSSFTAFLEHCGYTVKSKALRTRLDGSAKGDWDMEMALDIISHIGRLDVVNLVSGDGDFVPLVKLLQRHGICVEITAFRYNTAVDLREAADRYFPIGEDLIIDQSARSQPPPLPPAAGGGR